MTFEPRGCPHQSWRLADQGCRQFAGLALVAIIASALVVAQDTSAVGPPLAFDAGRTQAILLGSGTPFPDDRKVGSSLAVVTGGTAYLVDIGPGTFLRTVEAARRGVTALAWPTRLFLTHLHSDHVLDYADLLWALWWRREGQIEVYGPPGLRALTDGLRTAFAEDIRVRTVGPQPILTRGYDAEIHEIEGGLTYEDERVRITAFPVCHESVEAYGYRFETADRVIVISGDTTYCDRVVEEARGADLLFHEVFSERGLAVRTPAWQAYHRVAHSSPTQVAQVANEVRPGTLVLYHQLYFGVGDDELVAEVRAAGYDGPLVSGQDLDVF